MKKLLKISGFVLIFIVLVVGGLISYVKIALPNVGEPLNIEKLNKVTELFC